MLTTTGNTYKLRERHCRCTVGVPEEDPVDFEADPSPTRTVEHLAMVAGSRRRPASTVGAPASVIEVRRWLADGRQWSPVAGFGKKAVGGQKEGCRGAGFRLMTQKQTSEAAIYRNQQLEESPEGRRRQAKASECRRWQGESRRGLPETGLDPEGSPEGGKSWGRVGEGWDRDGERRQVVGDDGLTSVMTGLGSPVVDEHWVCVSRGRRNWCAVIQLPSQTLLLSVSDKACRLIGMLFPGGCKQAKSSRIVGC
ncbi:hypothetical protein RHGRI_026948 [Rhododendron griersonianum]|uniref:Uncharacterized protein n=1 Tax=Rhododendron griersonianum TaxID=479676 RepID=A0AAV6IX06_9ERIC|nr:hypothetical protein RHGRI_026948 [Rhododendron griersonianum]